MNPKEYISSGIVESYVMGLADEAERAEFEEICLRYPEVEEARVQFELALEQHALSTAVMPPAFVKRSVFDQLNIKNETDATPVVNLPMSNASDSDKVSAPVRQLGRLKLIAAASVILLLVSGALNFYFFGRYKEYSSRYADLLASQDQLVQNNKAMQTRLQSFENDMSLLKDPNNVIVKMPGSNVLTSPAPESLATVYWNGQSKDVYLMVNNMPIPSPGKQYQLWALVDGKPVDAGVFNVEEGSRIVKMKNIPAAQAFAITLENTGGSPVPTMEQLYVLGKV